MQRNLIVTVLVALIMASFVLAYTTLLPTEAQPQMGGGSMDGMEADALVVPPVRGFTEGQEIRFIHTEASTPQVADMLTAMMGSPVLVVPELADVPESARANVYVFQNGIKGDGPFGFQPDVFDNPPGTDDYSPLRTVNLITWVDEANARELLSADEVLEAEPAGELTIEQPGAVVNMPFLSWPGGQRQWVIRHADRYLSSAERRRRGTGVGQS